MDNNAACGTLVAVEEVLHNAAFANLGRKEKAQKNTFQTSNTHFSHAHKSF